jgi:hypothetical protein
MLDELRDHDAFSWRKALDELPALDFLQKTQFFYPGNPWSREQLRPPVVLDCSTSSKRDNRSDPGKISDD